MTDCIPKNWNILKIKISRFTEITKAILKKHKNYEQVWWLIEQNREHRNSPRHVELFDPLIIGPEACYGGKTLTNSAGKMGYLFAKEWNWSDSSYHVLNKI